MKGRRQSAVLLPLVLVFLMAGTVSAHFGHVEPNVVTLGGGLARSHNYNEAHVASALCAQTQMDTGATFSQPLVINFENGSWGGETVLFHLGETALKVATLNGNVIAEYPVQTSKSWGYITYAQQSATANSDTDVLYVTTGTPGIMAFAVDDLLPDRSPHRGLRAKGTPLGTQDFTQERFQGVQGIVSAPLYVGDDSGMDRVIISIVPNQIVLVKGLARRPSGTSPLVAPRTIPGWNSGTATLLEDLSRPIKEVAAELQQQGRDVRFALSAGPDFYIFSADNIYTPLWSRSTGSEGLSHVVRDAGNRLVFMTNSQGSLIAVDTATRQIDTTVPGFTAFTNSGLSTDGNDIYFGLRWMGSTSSGAPGSNSGTLVRVRREGANWPRFTTAIPISAPTGRSWINVSPIIWSDPVTPGRKVILAGDTGGTVTAWTPAGAPSPFFLNRGTSSLAPANCADVEGTTPPDINLANRTQLTDNPRKLSGSDSWINSQGVTTEMTLYGGRLFAGYTHANQSQSALVILRNATNLVLQDLQIDQVPPLRPGQAVTVKARVMLEGDPLGAPKTTTLAVGWAGYSPKTQELTLSPFEPIDVTFELAVPAGVNQVQLVATLNPSLYQTRYDHDVQRKLIPSTVNADALPVQLSPTWTTAAQGAASIGEAFVLDNARTQTLAVQGDDLAIRAVCPTGPVPGTYALPLIVTYAGVQTVTPEVRLRITGDVNDDLSRSDVSVKPNKQQPVPWRLDLDPGSYTLTASVVPPAGMVTENPANNSVTCDVEIMESCPDGQCGGGRSVLGR